ncbi:hypothetical protein BDN70DRAFT_870993, partial [Pholiota conissans]
MKKRPKSKSPDENVKRIKHGSGSKEEEEDVVEVEVTPAPPPAEPLQFSSKFFQQARCVKIDGGEINSASRDLIYINVNIPGPSNRNDARHIHDLPPGPVSATVSMQQLASVAYTNAPHPVPPHIRTVSPQPIDTTPSANPAMEQETERSARPFYASTNQTHHRTADERDHPSSTPATTAAATAGATYPETSPKIYERQLLPKRRGFPLWIPEPDRYLPLPCRRYGVSIGDIGTITSDGAFSFMFNIFRRAGHPINPPELPEGFKPLEYRRMDANEHSMFKPGSFLASADITKVRSSDPSFRGMSFKTSSTDGAILTFPDGAMTINFRNVHLIRRYAYEHLSNWYRFANGPRGLELKNGELHLVTGCDKATSWGMAAIANVESERHSLKYYLSPGDRGSDIPLYEWEYTGHTEARVGPDLEEIEELRQTDHDPEEAGIGVVGREGKFYNQCLFVRTLKLTLDEDEFQTIGQEIAPKSEAQSLQRHPRAELGARSNQPPQLPGLGTDTQEAGSWRQSESSSGMDSADLLVADIESLNPELDHLALGNTAWLEDSAPSMLDTAPRSHPANYLNKYLLKLHPHCKAVITH